MSKTSLLATLVLVSSSFYGCFIADHYLAQNRMNKSQDAYRDCIVANPENPDKCTALKNIYEEDKADFEK